MVAALISAIMTVMVVPLASRISIMDDPNARKIHEVSVPRTGGIAVMAGFAVALLLCTPPRWGVRIAIPVGAAWFTGLVDDIFELSPRLKLALESIAALAAVLLGFSFHLAGSSLDAIITVLWFLGYMNAFNLVDGLDGLASSVATVQVLGFLVLSAFSGSIGSLGPIAGALIGACLGFLIFNWHPARIFMGDSGSLLIGFTVALIGVLFQQSLPPPETWTGIIVVCSVTLYPIFDTLLSMYRRAKRGVSIFSPDRSHSYNLLVDFFGLKQTTVVCLISGLSILVSSATSAVFILFPTKPLVAVVPASALAFGAWVTRKAGLAYVDKASLAASKHQR